MFSPLLDIVKDDATVQALLGSDPRLWAFGEAPQQPTKPYAVQQTVGGSPENTLATVPDVDGLVVQIDVYADTAPESKAVTAALVDAIERNAAGYVTAWNGMFREFDTRLWRISFTAEFITPR